MSALHPTDHSHDLALDAALDYLNTRGLNDGVPFESLATPDDAAAWFASAGVIHPEQAVDWRQADLERARRVRDALREVVDSVVEERPVGAGAVDTVNAAIARTPTVALDASPSGLVVVHRHRGRPVDEAVGRIARTIVHELAEGEADRFRICANDECRWSFFDSSPTGRRRWCDMKTCGNRAKAARHRARVRSAATPAATSSAD